MGADIMRKEKVEKAIEFAKKIKRYKKKQRQHLKGLRKR